jgi:hypothetical protein
VKSAVRPVDEFLMINPPALLAELAEQCGDQVLFLRHRRLHRPGVRPRGVDQGVVPLAAVAASGVYVIGMPGQAEIRTERGRVRSTEVLDLGDTDPTTVLDALDRQVTAVRFALAGHRVTARGLLCLRPRTGSLVGSPTVAGVPLLTPVGIGRVLTAPGPLDHCARQAVYEDLARQLPPA